jgi:hypothetical protein
MIGNARNPRMTNGIVILIIMFMFMRDSFTPSCGETAVCFAGSHNIIPSYK